MFQTVSVCGFHASKLRDRLPQRQLEKGTFPTQSLLSKAQSLGRVHGEERGRWWGMEDGIEDLPETGQAIGWEIARFCGSPPSSACKLVMWGWQSLRTTSWKEPQEKSLDQEGPSELGREGPCQGDQCLY